MSGDNLLVRGRYKDEPLDDRSRHSIVLRGDDSSKDRQATNGDRRVADFFYHRGEYWTAVFPMDGVAQIYGQTFNFSKPRIRSGDDGPEKIYDSFGVPKRKIPFLNHLQTRFRLKPGKYVDLYPVGSEPIGEPECQVADFVYSIEAAGPKGVGFGLRDGLNGSLVSAHRIFSTEEMVFERIVVEGQYVLESPPLPVTELEKRTLLEKSLSRSDRAGMTEAYYLYRCCATNNCTSNPLQLLDRTVRYSWLQWIGANIYRLPLHPRFYLWIRGMDTDPKRRKLLRTEFASFVEDPETQQRKRHYVKTQIRELRAERAARRQ